ncbi:2-methylcitrate dehydratase PrpD [Delitschia confertaspora ATCC 74209]|uniref:2-methylcitrate dehydratase PrpD n=1 Tax=Delitschia confertaspora ATCC 74209 TaxID=1513339 RepID=A0A9P4JLL4_9PLEO|nr:2-methylcitrate dehydratase PrpD [Delitschia confertaspora ATCC 74209]
MAWSYDEHGDYFRWFPAIRAPIALHTFGTSFSGQATSSILGGNETQLAEFGTLFVDAQIAALVNGIASHVDDYDDTHLATIIHPAGPVALALLAIAESRHNITGRDFLTAFVAGVEAECKLGLSVYPEHYDVGWHITSITGSIGAAVAVGTPLNLTTTKMQHAIGIASTQVVGMQEFFGSDTKSFHVGRAAQGGMRAALLAENGYTSSLQALEAKFGWLNIVSTRENATAYFDQLGKVWEIERNSFKPFPCGIVMHPAIDGAIQLSKYGEFYWDHVESVEVRVNPQVLVLTGKTSPQTGLEGKFSIYHAVAIEILYGEATPAQSTGEVVRNSTVVELRKKVNVTTDKGIRTDEAVVKLKFKGGKKAEKHVEHAVASVENPLTDEDLKQKFLGQVGRAMGDGRVEKAFSAISNFNSRKRGWKDLSHVREAYEL